MVERRARAGGTQEGPSKHHNTLEAHVEARPASCLRSAATCACRSANSRAADRFLGPVPNRPRVNHANTTCGDVIQLQMAGTLLGALPTLAHVVVARYFVRGLLAGPLKGKRSELCCRQVLLLTARELVCGAWLGGITWPSQQQPSSPPTTNPRPSRPALFRRCVSNGRTSRAGSAAALYRSARSTVGSGAGPAPSGGACGERPAPLAAAGAARRRARRSPSTRPGPP